VNKYLQQITLITEGPIHSQLRFDKLQQKWMNFKLSASFGAIIILVIVFSALKQNKAVDHHRIMRYCPKYDQKAFGQTSCKSNKHRVWPTIVFMVNRPDNKQSAQSAR